MEVDEDDFEQPSSSDNNKASKKRFEVKKVKSDYKFHFQTKVSFFEMFHEEKKIIQSIFTEY